MRTHAEWNVLTHMIFARPPTSSVTRSRISAAALLVNVIARIEPGWALRSEISQAIRRVSTRVLPEPAPATTSSGAPSWIDGLALGLVESLEQLLAGRPRGGRFFCASPAPPSVGGRRLRGKTGKGELRAHVDPPYVRDRTGS